MRFERFLERFLLLIGQIATEFVPRDVGIVTQLDGGPNADALDAGKTHRYLAQSVDVRGGKPENVLEISTALNIVCSCHVRFPRVHRSPGG